MRPYFQTELGDLYQSDAIQLLRTFKTGSARLVVADPPYGIGKAEWDTFEDRQRYVEWSLSWIKEAARVLDDRGTLYMMGFPEILADVKFLASEHFEGCRWLVWYYRNKANLGRNWGRAHEAVLCFRKTRRAIFNLDAVRIPYNAHTLKYPARPQAESSHFSRPSGKHKKQVWTPHPLGAKPKDVLEIPTLCNGTAEKTDHPTQKPLDLIRRFVLASSNPGNLVIDPFAGSGTTLVACEESGRRWIGCDNDRSSCEIIRKRMSDPRAFEGEQTLEARRAAVTRRRARLRHRPDPDRHEHAE